MTDFSKITFSRDEGKLKIFTTGNDIPIYTHELFIKPIKLKVTSNSGNWQVDWSNESPPTNSRFTSIVPFGEKDNLCELSFGRISAQGEMKVNEIKGQHESKYKDLAIAYKEGFYMIIIGQDPAPNPAEGFIGTDDLRNGKANINVFFMEGKNLYLKLTKDNLTGAEYSLAITYDKK